MKRFVIIALFLSAFSGVVSAETSLRYRIDGVAYDLDGRTRSYALSQAVKIDTVAVFESEEAINLYIDDLLTQLRNQRVLDSVDMTRTFGEPDSEGIVPVALTIKAVDTWNIMAVPYPKYDSNTGFQLKLKLKDFNFFGSMQPLTMDVIYRNDENHLTHLGGTMIFQIPFRMYEHDMVWNVDASVDVPIGDVPEIHFTTSLDVIFPVNPIVEFHVGGKQGFALNDRDDNDVKYADDPNYFTEIVYANMPVLLYDFDEFGKAYWTPSLSLTSNWEPSGIQHPDLMGPDIAIAHALSFGRVNWTGNFRDGMMLSIRNSYTYDFSKPSYVAPEIDWAVQGYKSVAGIFAINGQFSGYSRFDGSDKTNAAATLRGISDDRIKSDQVIMLNVDFPVKVFTIDFEKTKNFKKLDLFSFEAQLSPFLDVALFHDHLRGTYFSPADGFYSGGLEMIVFPKRMRSIYGRACFGYDLVELATNGFSMDRVSDRDGKSLYDIIIGIGLHY